MQYVSTTDADAECIFCDHLAKGDEVLHKGPTAFVLLNAFPYNTGHLMVAPHRHVGDLEDLRDDEVDEIWAWTRRAIAAHRATTKPEGFNIGINLGAVAGAGVPGHVHLHVVPRWGGDTNFMPVIGQTKVLPELLEETYDRLAPAFAAEASSE